MSINSVNLGKCSICLDELVVAKGNVAKTPCNHYYDVDCIEGYARNKFASIGAHVLINRRDRHDIENKHDFTFEVDCPNCRKALEYKVNLLAANTLSPNGEVVAGFSMEFLDVEVLDTSGNPIERLDPTPLDQEIEKAISNNQLQPLPPPIGSLVGLQHLYLSNNQIRTLPPEIGRLVNLQSLFLEDNQLPDE